MTLLLSLLLATPAPVPAGQLTYLANEGFLISAGGNEVLIDALHRGSVREYPKLPEAMQQEIEAARGVFAGVDLVLVTHYHGDHFDPEATGRHLLANPKARLISTPQVVEKLQQGFPSFAQIAERATGVLPEEGEYRKVPLDLPGLMLTVVNLHHGRGGRPPTQNLGFLLEVNGVKLLHVGDTSAVETDWALLALDKQQVDVALLPYWQVDGEEELATIRRHVAPRVVVPMHWPAADAAPRWFGEDGNLDGLLARMGKIEHTVIVSRAGETKTFAELLP